MPKLTRLAENVYGVTDLWHPIGIGVNAGFIITPKSIIHIDSGMTINDGRYLAESAMRKAGGKKNITLILTHHHSDHIFGMRVFKEMNAKIIAHENLRKFLLHRRPPLFRRILDEYKPFVVKLMVEKLSYSREKAEEILGDVKLYPPDQVFKNDMEIEIGGEKLTLLYTPGHVPSEISIYHPSSKTLFAGDTIYEGMPPTTRFGGPKEWRQWIKSLEKLEKLDIKNIVPGHGKICGKNEIRRNISYLEEILSQY